jgi:hypothetical protein
MDMSPSNIVIGIGLIGAGWIVGYLTGYISCARDHRRVDDAMELALPLFEGNTVLAREWISKLTARAGRPFTA